MILKIPVGPGELLDKISILEIKLEKITDPAKRENVDRELDWLNKSLENVQTFIPAETKDALAGRYLALKRVNLTLWGIEDEIRKAEAAQDFGETFVELARAVYKENDERSRIKREINVLLGSEIVEEKEYTKYEGTA